MKYFREICFKHAKPYPLDELLKQGKKFVWSSENEQAFVNFKKILSSDLLLTQYNPELDIIVAVDASSIKLGATSSPTALSKWSSMRPER